VRILLGAREKRVFHQTRKSRRYGTSDCRKQRYARLRRLLARSKRPKGYSASSSASRFSVFPSLAGSTPLASLRFASLARVPCKFALSVDDPTSPGQDPRRGRQLAAQRAGDRDGEGETAAAAGGEGKHDNAPPRVLVSICRNESRDTALEVSAGWISPNYIGSMYVRVCVRARTRRHVSVDISLGVIWPRVRRAAGPFSYLTRRRPTRPLSLNDFCLENVGCRLGARRRAKPGQARPSRAVRRIISAGENRIPEARCVPRSVPSGRRHVWREGEREREWTLQYRREGSGVTTRSIPSPVSPRCECAIISTRIARARARVRGRGENKSPVVFIKFAQWAQAGQMCVFEVCGHSISIPRQST